MPDVDTSGTPQGRPPQIGARKSQDLPAEPLLVIGAVKKEDAEPEAQFHSIGAHEMGVNSTDPEFGVARHADRRSAVRKMRRSVGTQFGQLLTWLIIAAGLAGGLTFSLSSELWQTSGILSVLLLPALLVLRLKYRRWKRNRGYLYRLSETLGEPVEFH